MNTSPVNEKEFHSKFDDSFWATINLVNRQFKKNFLSFNNINIKPTEQSFKNLQLAIGNQAFMAFIEKIEACKSLIDQETILRIEKNMESFADENFAGGDDCHFMDMPYHLIAKGKPAVVDYLFNDGYFVGCAIESFSYGYQSIVRDINS